MFTHEYWMKLALKEAEQAFEKEEVPVGCIVVYRDKLIARAHNLTECLGDVTAHAEMHAITAASHFIGGKYLTDCDVYVSLEPCVMCAGALYWARISNLFIGARDPERGFIDKGLSLHVKTKVTTGILEKECSFLMKNFFRKRR